MSRHVAIFFLWLDWSLLYRPGLSQFTELHVPLFYGSVLKLLIKVTAIVDTRINSTHSHISFMYVWPFHLVAFLCHLIEEMVSLLRSRIIEKPLDSESPVHSRGGDG